MRICKEVQDWVEEEVEQPVEEWEDQQQQYCENQSCIWWMACLNQLVCWMIWVAVKVTRWVLVTVGKWVTRVVCEIVTFFADAVGAAFGLALSIPVVGGIIRTIWNWVTDVFWHLVGFPDFLLSLAGVRLRKKMYVGVIVPSVDGTPIAQSTAIQDQIDATVAFYDQVCNIDVIFTGVCYTPIPPPKGALTVGCDVSGFFADWWIAGSYFELATTTCRFTDSFRRATGLGAEIIIFYVQEITPAATVGCSFGSSHNYILLEPNPGWVYTAAHEIAHACGMLWHVNDSTDTNLMDNDSSPVNPTLTNTEIAIIRWSKHCVYF